MLSDNKRFRDFIGVTKFHEAGYTGKRVLVASGEDFYRYATSHSGETYRVFREFCPEAEVIYLPVIDGTFGSTIDSKFLTYSIPEIVKRGVNIVWASQTVSVNGSFLDEALKQINPFCTVFMSAGNDGADGYNRFLDSEHIHGIGAYRLMYGTNDIAPVQYSSISDKVDFCAPTDVYIPSANGGYNYKFGGTSCACPVLAAVSALINDFFIDKTGQPLSSQMMYQFLKDYSKDVYIQGKDTKTGWGAPILPDPNSIDIDKYATREEPATVKTYSLSKDGNARLSANFQVKEFACKDGSDLILVDTNLVAILQDIRSHFKKPVNLTSAYRNAAYNASIGGATNSYHIKGMAADITINGLSRLEIAQYAESKGANGIGLYDYENGFVHIDSRPIKSFWKHTYNGSPEIRVETFIEKELPWWHEAQKHVMATGISDGTRPDDKITRAEVWEMIRRMK